MSATYKCCLCNKTFEKGWSDEEAMREYVEAFGPGAEPPAVVCDDCYQVINAAKRNAES